MRILGPKKLERPHSESILSAQFPFPAVCHATIRFWCSHDPRASCGFPCHQVFWRWRVFRCSDCGADIPQSCHLQVSELWIHQFHPIQHRRLFLHKRPKGQTLQGCRYSSSQAWLLTRKRVRQPQPLERGRPPCSLDPAYITPCQAELGGASRQAPLIVPAKKSSTDSTLVRDLGHCPCRRLSDTSNGQKSARQHWTPDFATQDRRSLLKIKVLLLPSRAAW